MTVSLIRALIGSCLSLACVVSCVTAEESETRPTVERPDMVTRDQWGSDPLPIPEERRHTPKYITIHHAGVEWKAGSDAYQKVRDLQAWGKKPVEIPNPQPGDNKVVLGGGKDWPDLPYHYLIAPDGTIFEGRPVEYEPETNTSYDVRGHIGIQLYGNFETQRVSPQQVASVVELVAWLSQEYDVPDELIRGHRDVADTSCPGADFYRYLEGGQLLDWVGQVRAGESPTIELGPPLDDGPTVMIPVE